MTTARNSENEVPRPAGGSLGQQSLASIVPQAAVILREELRSLVTGRANAFPTALTAETLTRQSPSEAVLEPARSLVETVVNSLKHRPDLLEQLLRPVTNAGMGAGSANTERVLTLRAPGTVAAGDVAYILLGLQNDDDEADECSLYATDLIGAGGQRIPASHVRVHPNPARIPSAGAIDVQVEISVPRETRVGQYTGLVQIDEGETWRALIQVTVGS